MAASCQKYIPFLKRETASKLVLLEKIRYTNKLSTKLTTRSKHSLVSTSIPDVDSEIEMVSPQSLRGKAMRELQERIKQKKEPHFREERMAEDQDWTSVYPTQSSFKWSAVPLPVRMGFPVKRGIPPHKYGNAELVKIPNFLHLTKPAIKKHCAALKELTTEWPKGLETDEACEKHFPLEVETSNYCFSSPSIRHPKSRQVVLKVKLSDLPLDQHARWKFIQLVKDRYDKATDILTITTDRCPVRKQNYDYALYLLSVLVHESWITEPWEESEITEVDREFFLWDHSHSRKNAVNLKARIEDKTLETLAEIPKEKEAEILQSQEVQKFKVAVEEYRNKDETLESIDNYKEAALRLLGLDQNENIQAQG